jgi:hypothetical protein
MSRNTLAQRVDAAQARLEEQQTAILKAQSKLAELHGGQSREGDNAVRDGDLSVWPNFS